MLVTALKFVRGELQRVKSVYKFRRLVGRYVAVTGSCGKTTTATLITALLSRYASTVGGTHNNRPDAILKTVRRLRRRAEFVVQEVSGDRPGAIEGTTANFRIDIAVVTAVGLDHGAAFRTGGVDIQDAIAMEKGKLVEAVAVGGFACLNFDDPRVRAMEARTTRRVLGYGLSSDAEVRAINIDARWPHRLSFDVVAGNRTHSVTTRFVGTLMLPNVLGALAVIYGLGHDLGPAIDELANLDPVRDRMGVHAGPAGATYILDTEKASYWSTELLVDDLRRMSIEGLTLVLGDISDIVGSSSSRRYRKLIRSFAECAQTLVLAGRSADYGAKLAAELSNVVVAPTAYDVANYLKTVPPGVVLLKSNKSLQLWRVLDHVGV